MSIDQMLRVLHLRLRSLVLRDRVEDELAGEIEFHLEQRSRELTARGMTPQAAREAAVKMFGGVERRKEECRDQRRVGFVEDFLQDIRYALRMMRRSPVFSAVAIISLALGIGANTAIFTAIDAVMLRPLPLPHPEQLMLMQWTAPDFPRPFARTLEGGGGRSVGGSQRGGDMFPYPTFASLLASGAPVVAFAAQTGGANVGIGATAESAELIGVSGNYFRVLSVASARGRVLQEDDDLPGSSRVVVVSYGFWSTKLGATTEAVGRTISINGVPVTIVGVLPPDFFGLEPGTAPDLWVPLTQYAQPLRASWLTDSKIWWIRIVERVAGANSAESRARSQRVFLESIGAVGELPRSASVPGIHAATIPRGIDTMGQMLSRSLGLLMSMVALVLVITCANLAALLLDRANARRREMAVRLSLGVRRSRLVRQLVTESLALAFLGGIAALVTTAWTYPIVMSLLARTPLPPQMAFSVDSRILAFTAVLSVVVGVAFGLGPALQATRTQLVGALGERAVIGGTRQRTRRSGNVLIALQIAVCLVLLFGAGLFTRTLRELRAADVGFDRSNLLLFSVAPGVSGYAGARLDSYYEELYRRVVATPGVLSATVTRRPPIGAGRGQSSGRIGFESREQEVDFWRHEIGPGYFRTLGIGVLAGRVVDERDNANAPKVLVINETVAQRFFRETNPIGAHIDFGTPDAPNPYQIVGVVKDAKYSRIAAEVPPTVYLPYQQSFDTLRSITFIVRTVATPASVVAPIRERARALDDAVPITDIRTQVNAIERTLSDERTLATFSASLGVLALVIAAIGLYGTASYAVRRRTNEIGTRMALGAQPTNILSMFFIESVAVVTIGAVLGVPAALAAGRAVQSRLYDVSATDATTMVIAIAVLFVVTVAAALIPALRAARLDPITALRFE